MPSPWYRQLNRYHWLVLMVCSAGWLLDCMDQQIFGLARRPAMLELLHARPDDAAMAGTVTEYAGYATMAFMLGWAVGGVVFGILGDRMGRVKTMTLSILFYSIFTGLSVFSTGVWDFSAYRFLTGLGVGGQFAVGVALVAEVLPAAARPFALGALQSCSAAGNIIAALIGIGLGELQQAHVIQSAWRVMFIVGALPAFLVVIVMRRLKEPERWQRAKQDHQKLGSMVELFEDPRWRRNALVGFALAFAGVVGLWGIGYFSYDLLAGVLDKYFRAQGLERKHDRRKENHVDRHHVAGAEFGRVSGSLCIHLFHAANQPETGVRDRVRDGDAGDGVPVLEAEFFQRRVLDAAADGIFPTRAVRRVRDLFSGVVPDRLRSTGTSFCYNVGRGVAAIGPVGLGLLTSRVYAGQAEPLRLAGITMSAVFLIGLAVLPWAVETKGRPLPE